jgi:hypothetical protein
MEELWLQTRHPSEGEQRVVEELLKTRVKYGKLKLADLQSAFQRAKEHCPTLRVPSRLQLFSAKWSPLLVPNHVYTRGDLRAFWGRVGLRWRARQWFRIPLHLVPLNLLRDVQISLLFFIHMALAR